MREPAFPIPDGEAADRGHMGMSLRDWFAGQFLAGAAATMGEVVNPRWHQLAEDSYNAADAMMKQRNK